MRILPLAAALLASLCLGAAERISLGEVACTDAAYFWTQDGLRQPVLDRNLQGRAIAIGGQTYRRGLAGHTGFSAVYNLSGLATSFTCLVGLDDEDHPQDPAQGDRSADLVVLVLVDRKEVWRRTLRLGEPAVPLAVELTGAQQLELRGEYGKTGFFRQRIVFADPELVVTARDAFLHAADLWRQRAEGERARRLDYPAAPAWTTLDIRKVAYRGLGNAYRIATGKLEVIVAPELGGMIVSLAVPGGPNLLSEAFDPARVNRDRGRAPDGGGHFNRHQPKNQFLPPDPILLYGAYSIEFPAEGRIRLRSPESCYLFLRQAYELSFEPGGRGLHLVNIQENTAPFAQACGIWSITRVKPELATRLRIPAESPDPPRPATFEPRALAGLVRSGGDWNELDLSPALFDRLGGGSIEWQAYARSNRIEVAFGAVVFSKLFGVPAQPGDDLSGFYPTHLYLAKAFIELECHGPTLTLPPGGKVELHEDWTLAE